MFCRILGRQHFFWGWRRNWKPKNLRRMILLELDNNLLLVGFLVWYLSSCIMLVCLVVHLTTNINCTLLWVSIEMVFMNAWNEYLEVARVWSVDPLLFDLLVIITRFYCSNLFGRMKNLQSRYYFQLSRAIFIFSYFHNYCFYKWTVWFNNE